MPCRPAFALIANLAGSPDGPPAASMPFRRASQPTSGAAPLDPAPSEPVARHSAGRPRRHVQCRASPQWLRCRSAVLRAPTSGAAGCPRGRRPLSPVARHSAGRPDATSSAVPSPQWLRCNSAGVSPPRLRVPRGALWTRRPLSRLHATPPGVLDATSGALPGASSGHGSVPPTARGPPSGCPPGPLMFTSVERPGYQTPGCRITIELPVCNLRLKL